LFLDPGKTFRGFSMVSEQELATLFTPILEDMGYEMVRVQVTGTRNPTLQVMAERRDGVGMTVDDCATISRALSDLLEANDPFDDTYQLEVSSPGIDRPLVRPTDYERFAGFDARIDTREPVDGRKRFKGRLGGLDGNNVIVEQDGRQVAVPFASIHRAKLVLTDELIAAHQDNKA
jgi:ribosome maturation factor RimP